MTTWTVPGVVVSVVDGDTVKLDLDLGWKIWLREVLTRLEGIDAPETNTVEGKAARDYLRTVVLPGARVTLLSRSVDKYGRPLGVVTLWDGTDLSALMLSAGHAVPYFGGPR